LEYVRENGPTSVGALTDSDYIRVSNAHVSRRCSKLAEHGLLQALGNGVYSITERGEGYLDGKIDISEDAQDEVMDASASSEGANGENEV